MQSLAGALNGAGLHVVRFLDEQTVVVNDYCEENRGYGTRLTYALRRNDLRIEKLPYFCTGEMVDGIPSERARQVGVLHILTAAGQWLACLRQPAEHQMDHRHLDQGFTRLAVELVIPRQRSALAQPAECPLHNPPPRQRAPLA